MVVEILDNSLYFKPKNTVLIVDELYDSSKAAVGDAF